MLIWRKLNVFTKEMKWVKKKVISIECIVNLDTYKFGLVEVFRYFSSFHRVNCTNCNQQHIVHLKGTLVHLQIRKDYISSHWWWNVILMAIPVRSQMQSRWCCTSRSLGLLLGSRTSHLKCHSIVSYIRSHLAFILYCKGKVRLVFPRIRQKKTDNGSNEFILWWWIIRMWSL